MGRFYRTAKPQFIDDIVYQPPWKLAQQVLTTQQKGYDDALQKSELIKDMVDVKHLGFEDNRVRAIKERYNDQIDQLTNQIAQNPMEYRRTLPALRNLTRELNIDRKEGDIANIERRYADWNNWVKENQDVLKSDPGLYNRLARHWYDDIQNRSQEDLGAQFAGVKGILRPDINSKAMKDALSKFKSNATEYSNGRYKIGNKWLSEEEVQQATYDLYMSDPNVEGYIHQMGNVLQDPGFYNRETGQLRNIYNLVDRSGNPISAEQAEGLRSEYNKLSPAEQEKQGVPFSRQLNMEHALSSGFRGWGNILGFQESTMDVDQYGLESVKAANRERLAAQKDANSMKRLQYGKQADYNKMIKEYELKSKRDRDKINLELEIDAIGGDEDAAKALVDLTRGEFYGTIPNPKISYGENTESIVKGSTSEKRTALGRENKAHEYAMSKIGSNLHSPFIENIASSIKTGKPYIEGKMLEDYIVKYNTDTRKRLEKDPSWRALLQFRDSMENRDYLSGHEQSVRDATTRGNVRDLLDKYKEYKQEYFNDKYSQAKSQHAFEPLTTEAEVRMKGILTDDTKYDFDFVNDGNEQADSEAIQVDKVLGATGAGSRGYIAYRVKDTEGNEFFAFPKNPVGAAATLTRNIAYTGIKDRQSSVIKEFQKPVVSRLAHELNAQGPDINGFKSINYEFNDIMPGLRLPIQNRGGIYHIIDPTTNQPVKSKPNGFTTLEDLVNFITPKERK